MSLPALTTAQMVEVDRLMIEEYGILLLQMMENAGRNLAELSRRWLAGRVAGRRIVVLCGGGNNGGGGMVAARHLHNWGATVTCYLAASPDRLKEVPAHQWRILQHLDLTPHAPPALEGADLLLDALIGYGLAGNPRGTVAAWIRLTNESGLPILSLDAPSGLDSTSGNPGDPCIRAAATLTLALPKVGLLSAGAKEVVGRLYLADISVPPQLYSRLGLHVESPFTGDSLVAL